MTNASLGDPSNPVKHHCPFCNNSLSGEIDWPDLMAENIDKLRALITVAAWNGIGNCGEATRHHYLSVLDDLANILSRCFQQLSIKGYD